MKNIKIVATLLWSMLAVVACKKSYIDPANTDAGTSTYNASALLTNVTVNVILPTYTDIDVKAADLLTAITNFKSTQDSATLAIAKQAFLNARTPWEQSEAFAFGPVSTLGIDAACDSWPLNATDINAILSSAVTIDKIYVDGLSDTQKGYHCIEFLLWGSNHNKLVGDFTAREYDYLLAAIQSLKGQTALLLNAWKSTGGDFGTKFSGAGIGSTIYTSQRSALQELANSNFSVADEVGNSKIDKPLVEQNAVYEESQWSQNTKAELQDNIRGIQNVYLGTYNSVGNGIGMSDLVKTKNADLDAQFKLQLTEAIHSIGNIPGKFSDAIINNKSAVQDAQTKVRVVQSTLEEKILPIVNGL